jgi:hypothetical protein
LLISYLLHICFTLGVSHFFNETQGNYNVWKDHVRSLKGNERLDHVEQICFAHFFVTVFVQEVEKQVLALLGIDAHKFSQSITVLPEIKALTLSEMQVFFHDLANFVSLLLEFLLYCVHKLLLVHFQINADRPEK